ncbi:MAG: hypothetical protein VX737_00265 [Pseudomonadota bacterium]|nr:hypothetical protein [Pseudomonadota bacterium]
MYAQGDGEARRIQGMGQGWNKCRQQRAQDDQQQDYLRSLSGVSSIIVITYTKKIILDKNIAL